MSDFPALEVLTPGGHGLEPGTRLPLFTSPFVIGRARDNQLSVQSGLISKRHCEVLREYDRWWIRDLGTTNGTFHLGERVNDAELLHGDVFELANHASFRLLLREPVDLRDAAMEQAIVDQPDDDRRWSVYADWLQEHGAPLGERIANPRSSDDRRWLGPFATFVARGELEVRWAHGLPTRAVLRRTELQGHQWDRELGLLAKQPEFRFLRGLELDVGAFRDQRAWGPRVIAALSVDALPLLQQFTIGPLMNPPAVEAQVKALLDARRKRWPWFTTTPETLFASWKPATLTWGDQVFELRPGVRFEIGPRGTTIELGQDAPSFALALHHDRWLLSTDSKSNATVKVNGVPKHHAPLRAGDVIEPMPGVLLRFGA
jgi:uncharacterized protein (TIGR02996 family)